MFSFLFFSVALVAAWTAFRFASPIVPHIVSTLQRDESANPPKSRSGVLAGFQGLLPISSSVAA